mgnify:CR=1 FL=1
MKEKRFLRFYKKDKGFIKMINQSEKGFDLIITNDNVFNDILNTIKNCKENNIRIDIVWQMKWKLDNFVLYKNCIFSEPEINYFIIKKRYMGDSASPQPCGKKIRIICDSVSHYSDSEEYKHKQIKNKKEKYKDGLILNRMLKINELKYKSEEYD